MVQKVTKGAEPEATMQVVEPQLEQQGGGIEHEQENIEVLEMPFDKAMNMLEHGEIKDAKTIILLQYAKLHNLI